jgi:hypothetical protein
MAVGGLCEPCADWVKWDASLPKPVSASIPAAQAGERLVLQSVDAFGHSVEEYVNIPPLPIMPALPEMKPIETPSGEVERLRSELGLFEVAQEQLRAEIGLQLEALQHLREDRDALSRQLTGAIKAGMALARELEALRAELAIYRACATPREDPIFRAIRRSR